MACGPLHDRIEAGCVSVCLAAVERRASCAAVNRARYATGPPRSQAMEGCMADRMRDLVPGAG